ncbi:hypothetical protein ACWEOZ_23220 [Actinoplanes sp. NPDC004185]
MTPARRIWISVGTFCGVVAFLLVGVLQLLDEKVYGALTDGIQALGVVAALTAAAATLRSDSRNRTLDRALGLHQELMSGEVGAARVRLVRHLRGHGRDSETPTKLAELRKGELATYSHALMELDEDSVKTHRPDLDLNILLRYFERADSAREAKAVFPPVFANLVGDHAAWWSRALTDDGSNASFPHLMGLAEWRKTYAADQAKQLE